MTYNPSAGKFEPPPLPPSPEEERRRGKWKTIALLMLIGSVVIEGLLLYRGDGWVALAIGVAAFLFIVAEYIVHRKRVDEAEGKDPYSPPTSITR